MSIHYLIPASTEVMVTDAGSRLEFCQKTGCNFIKGKVDGTKGKMNALLQFGILSNLILRSSHF